MVRYRWVYLLDDASNPIRMLMSKTAYFIKGQEKSQMINMTALHYYEAMIFGDMRRIKAHLQAMANDKSVEERGIYWELRI